MPERTLCERVTEFFERQIAWYGLVLEDLDGLDARLDDAGLETLEGQRSCYDGDIQEQERQLRELLDEWQKAPKAPEPEVRRVRDLARRAEELAARVAGELLGASERAGAKAQEVRRDLASLQKGRQVFCRYRQTELENPGFVDEKV